jgi:chromatin segregation and condensation protein Rec8/ScpA/Scc1 (kleisin family)
MGAGTADPAETPDGAGQGPRLTLDGFAGPLERLLTLARARQVDLARVSLTVLADQLAKQGDVALTQEAFLSPIQVRITSTGQSQSVSDQDSGAC